MNGCLRFIVPYILAFVSESFFIIESLFHLIFKFTHKIPFYHKKCDIYRLIFILVYRSAVFQRAPGRLTERGSAVCSVSERGGCHPRSARHRQNHHGGGDHTAGGAAKTQGAT